MHIHTLLEWSKSGHAASVICRWSTELAPNNSGSYPDFLALGWGRGWLPPSCSWFLHEHPPHQFPLHIAASAWLTCQYCVIILAPHAHSFSSTCPCFTHPPLLRIRGGPQAAAARALPCLSPYTPLSCGEGAGQSGHTGSPWLHG